MAVAEVIKYEGDNSTFIWKHPSEDFNSLTQLIVHESQEAVFFMNGQALDLFGPGRYTLETQNIPMVGKLLKGNTGSDTPFHCEVYFINKTVQMALKWGTDSKVRYIDPQYGIPMELGASGDMNLSVSDSRRLLVKLVGTMSGIAWGDERAGFTKSLQASFRPLISTMVKSNLSTAIKEGGYSVLEVDEHLDELSKTLKSKIEPGFEEYGLSIPQFYLTTIVLPEDDPSFRRIRELHTMSLQKRMAAAEAEIRAAKVQADAEVKLAQARAEAGVAAAQREVEMERQTTETEIARREAERSAIAAAAEANALRQQGYAEAEVMRAKGYDQKDVMQAEVQKAFAEGLGNMGSGGGGGSVIGDVLGIGLGIKAAGAVGNQLGGIFDSFNQPASTPAGPAATVKCPKCGAELPENAKFCLSCGEKIEKAEAGMVICPECGQQTPKGKFCIHCGHKFVSTCPNCRAEVPEGGKFCLECGTQL